MQWIVDTLPLLLMALKLATVIGTACDPALLDRRRFTELQAKSICDRLTKWNGQRSSQKLQPLSSTQLAYLEFLQNCAHTECLVHRFPSDEDVSDRDTHDKSGWRCQHQSLTGPLNGCNVSANEAISPTRKVRRKRQIGKNSMGLATRREYRTLRDRDRKRLHKAMEKLKYHHIEGVSKWDIITARHYPHRAPGAHFGPAFLPWHREFLRQFEVALRNEDPGVALAYWDTTLDQPLPDARDSILWTEEFLGNGNGHVTTGPFARWPTAVPMPGYPHIRTLYRSLGSSRIGQLMGDADVDWVLTQKRYSELTFCSGGQLEATHGLPHMWVGGFMNIISISPNDPVFYLLHAFVDYLWERFRRTRQSYWQRETDYVDENMVCNQYHGVNDTMLPFSITNKNGLLNVYTQDWFNYARSPVCHFQTQTNRSYCGSKYLFCHTITGRCLSKIREGGNCTGLEAMEACLHGKCLNRICVADNPYRGRHLQTRKPLKGLYVWTKVLLVGKYGRPIVTTSAQIRVKGVNYDADETYAPISRGLRYPAHMGIAYIRLQRPLLTNNGVSEAVVTASDEYGQACQAYCYDGNSYRHCNGLVTLTPFHESSNPVAFTHSKEARRFLNTNLTPQHPLRWIVSAPYLNFYCDHESNADAFDLPPTTATLDGVHTAVDVWFLLLLIDNVSDVGRAPLMGAVVEVYTTGSNSSYYRTVFDDRRTRYSTNDALPIDSKTMLVRAPNPFKAVNGRTEVKVFVRLRSGQYCRRICIGVFVECTNTIELTAAPTERSTNFAFDFVTASFINWNLNGHPTTWKNEPPNVQFDCK